jgi:hypothetical protein
MGVNDVCRGKIAHRPDHEIASRVKCQLASIGAENRVAGCAGGLEPLRPARRKIDQTDYVAAGVGVEQKPLPRGVETERHHIRCVPGFLTFEIALKG